jgi:hypothetical protein
MTRTLPLGGLRVVRQRADLGASGMSQVEESVVSQGEPAQASAFDMRQIGAAASKLVAASVGEMALVLAREGRAIHERSRKN